MPVNRDNDRMYQQHRERIAGAKSKIDQSPPQFQAMRLTGVNNLRDDARIYMNRTRENIQLLVELSRTMRTHGATNPFRQDELVIQSGVPALVTRLELIERDNRDLGKRILEVRSEVDSGLNRPPQITDAMRRVRRSTPIELAPEFFAKYETLNVTMPKSIFESRRLLRPRVFFDIYLKDVRPLGRIFFQLYTEAAPLVVLEFVRACLCCKTERFHIRRVFPSLWMDIELDIALPAHMHEQSRLERPLEYDARCINHGNWSQIISFSNDFVTGFQKGIACFSVSFKPLDVSNGHRVGFGRVCKGSKIVDCLQRYGTKNGKLSKAIVVTNCGLS